MFALWELDERKQKILDALVRNYIHTAEPVGSLTIWQNYIHAFSPATIRNEMADLEEAGYISSPHPSAGRIPTDYGYRYYVDHLMKRKDLTAKEEKNLRKEFSYLSFEIEEALPQTVRILSHTLEYAAIIVNLESHKRIFSAGLSNILHQPEFQKINQARHLLELLEEEEVLTEIAEEYANPEEITIKIGSENKYKQTKECSVIVASYEFGEERGGIEVIGPTRMFYNKAIRVIKFAVKELKRIGEKR